MSIGRNTVVMWGVAGVLSLALVTAVAYKLKLGQEEVIASAELDSSCDLHQSACTLTIPGGGKVTFSITPRPVPVIEKLALSVYSEALAVQAVTVDFNGVDMNMGINRFTLKEESRGRFMGNGMLPVCVRNRMTWEARVMLKTDNGVVIAPFRFDTTSRS